MTVVVVFVLGGRNQADLTVQPSVVEPVDVLGDGDLEVINASPRPAVADELGLEQAVERLGEGVEAPIDVKCSGDLVDGRFAVLTGEGDGREQVVDLAGEVALEAADDLSLGQPLGGASSGVVDGGLVPAESRTMTAR